MKTLTKNSMALAGLALGVSLMTAGLPQLTAAEEIPKKDEGFLGKMEQWQNQMSEKFRDTWKSLRSDTKDPSLATASVDLREDEHDYTLRLNLPGRDLDKVDIKLLGETLRIVAPAGDSAGRYEQTVALTGVNPNAEPKIERKPKDDMIVVTVRKSPLTAEKKSWPLTAPDSVLSPLSDWENDIFDRMAKMSREMDVIFEDAFRELRSIPEHKDYFDEPRFGSSIDLKEDRENYIFRAYLPDRSMQNVNVTVEDRVLKIEATEQDTTNKDDKAGTLRSTRKAAYAQLVTLPGPVRGEQMKVEKKDGLLVVTLPKAL
jgi:HSP20 family molecular chaperone IbpA